ncbi:InlB B-repeat-containing protein, partial [Bifidobacterium pseudocatenulatum]|uniref:InlB B-repeat-containing protein n=1 Tax=Bifidobacterium pseudocatenulatum TaxID=28026 RepID=UPI001C704AD3
MSFSKKIIAGVAAVATLAALAPAVAMAEGDAPATQQQTQNEVKIFNVMVHANGGTFTSGNNTGQAGDYMVTVQDGGSLVSALPQVQRDGYLFAGWSYDKDGKSPVVATDFVSAYTEVYAQWTKQKPVVDAKQFNVTVSTNGGTIADGDHKGEAGDIQVSAAQDSVLVNALPQVQRDGYLFAGWSYDKDGKSPVVATDFVSAYTVVYAQWVKKVEEAQFFNVKVNSNGGTFIDGTDAGCAGDTMVSVKKDGSLVSALPQVQRDGYLFAGWSYDKDGKSPVVATDFVSA